MHRVQVDTVTSSGVSETGSSSCSTLQANQCRGAKTAAEQASIDPPPTHPPPSHRCYVKCSFAVIPLGRRITAHGQDVGGGGVPPAVGSQKTNICSEYAEMASDRGNCYSWVKGKRLLEAASGLAAARWARHQSRSADLTQNSDSVWVGGWQIFPPPPPQREKLRLIKQVCKIYSYTTTECQLVGIKTLLGGGETFDVFNY